MFFETLLFTTTALYTAAVLYILYLMLKKVRTRTGQTDFVSVVIAARNEAQRIKPALDSLAQINYPAERYEIIFVDDNSQDETVSNIKSFRTPMPSNWQVVSVKSWPGLSGKKAALHTGILQAKGDIILTTDADCRVNPQWIQSMVSVFESRTLMVLGHALLEKSRGLWYQILRFDNLFSGLMVAAPAKAGVAISSVGRNMAYRKKAYLQSGGYPALAQFSSGDDVHLTELFRTKLTGEIVFNDQPEVLTWSRIPDSRREVYFQQIRKNSKLLKKSLPAVVLSILLFLYLVLLVLFPVYFPAYIASWWLALALKMIPEFITLAVATTKLGEKSLIPWFPVFQLFYPLYVTFFAILGTFKKYEWKK